MADKPNNLTQERKGVFDIVPGAGIMPTIAEAIERSKHEGRPITFNFSDVPVTVEAESNPELIRRDMCRAWEQLHQGSTQPVAPPRHPHKPRRRTRDVGSQSGLDR